MKKDSKKDELREEYDLSKLKGRIRGKYVERFKAGTNLVLLDSDVADAFRTTEEVNDALRALMKVARNRVRVQSRSFRSFRDCDQSI